MCEISRSYEVANCIYAGDAGLEFFIYGDGIALHLKAEVLDGKSVVVVDDSIVRGTTMRKLVKLIRGAGAREVTEQDFDGMNAQFAGADDLADLMATHDRVISF